MSNFRLRPEVGLGYGTGKQSLFLPAMPRTPAPFPRSLVMEGPALPAFRPFRATPLPNMQVARGEAPGTPPPTATREEPAAEWRVETINLTPLAIAWLDSDVLGRFMPTRRSVVVINHDPANGVWIKQVGVGVGTGGYVPPSGSIALPLGPLCRVYGLGIAVAGSNISFYQLGG